MLVHGDFSPKNLLIGPAGPVILDAECAWYGDPAFDLAFVLNHLLLKGAWRPQWRARYLDAFAALAAAYLAHVALGAAGELRGARRGAAAGSHARAHRRQVAGRVPDRRRRRRTPCGASRARCSRDPVARARREIARALARRWSATMSGAITSVHAPPRLGFARPADAWKRRSRSASGAVGRAIAPAGASRGSREAIDLRDGGARFGGMDVTQAIANVERRRSRARSPAATPLDQAGIDAALIALDGTPNKAKLGGNATVAVSLAVAHAAAAARGCAAVAVPRRRRSPVSLPLPEIQIFGGGAHAGRRIDIQDLMVMPRRRDVVRAGARDDRRGLSRRRRADARRRQARRRGRRRRLVAGVRHQRGGARRCSCARSSAPAIVPGDDVAISLDIAASEFGRDGRYRLGLERRELDRDGMIELLLGWLDRYPIVSIEDPLAEDDRDGWIAFTRAAGTRVQIIGDDYLTTNADARRGRPPPTAPATPC